MIKLIGSTFFEEQHTKKQLVNFITGAEKLSMGDECEKFESNFAQLQNRKYATFVSNGSMANLILVQSLLNLGILKRGNNIGFSALTWSTNVMPLIQLGLNPIPIDCELDTLNISLAKIKTIKTKLKGIFITNVLGLSDEINNIKTYCKENNIVLFEDNCESLGSEINGKLLGNFGIAATFSFFVGHHLSTIEGGMIVTDNFDLYEMCKMVRAHGWDRNLSTKTQKKLRTENAINDFYAKYSFYDLAFNGRPTEINGFIGNIQLQCASEIIQKRVENFNKFYQASTENPDIIPLKVDHMDRISNMAFPIVLKTKSLLKKYKKLFEKNEVEIRPLIAGDMTIQPFFKKYVKTVNKNLPNVKHIHECGIYIPNHPELSKKDINLLCSIISNGS